MQSPLMNFPRLRIEKMKYPSVRYYSYQKRLIRHEGADLIAYADGTYRVDDEDEFLAHQREYDYPSAIVERARAELDGLIAAHAARVFPFDGSLAAFVPEAYRRS